MHQGQAPTNTTSENRCLLKAWNQMHIVETCNGSTILAQKLFKNLLLIEFDKFLGHFSKDLINRKTKIKGLDKFLDIISTWKRDQYSDVNFSALLSPFNSGVIECAWQLKLGVKRKKTYNPLFQQNIMYLEPHHTI